MLFTDESSLTLNAAAKIVKRGLKRGGGYFLLPLSVIMKVSSSQFADISCVAPCAGDVLGCGIVGSLTFRSPKPRRETCWQHQPFPIPGMEAGLGREHAG